LSGGVKLLARLLVGKVIKLLGFQVFKLSRCDGATRLAGDQFAAKKAAEDSHTPKRKRVRGASTASARF
jgi:hypothetical protein